MPEFSKELEDFIKQEETAVDRDIHKSDNIQKTDLMNSLYLMLNDKNLEGKTILNNRQVVAISMMNWGGQVYGIDFLKEFVAKFSRYRISGDNGIGRQQLIDIAKAIQLQKEKEHENLMQALSLNR